MRSRFEVGLDNGKVNYITKSPLFESAADQKPRFARVFYIFAILLAVLLLIVGVSGYIYYQGLKQTPQYSLALLVDAAKHDDRQAMEEFIDIDAVVEDFIPQITAKAVELYSRGVSSSTLEKVAALAKPILPAVKDRARAELPSVIRARTARFGYIPFFAMVLGAERYLEIRVDGEAAFVTSKLPEHSLEIRMRKRGDRWQIIGVSDEQLATDIARHIGQEIILLATGGINKETAETLGVGNLADLLRQAEELVR